MAKLKAKPLTDAQMQRINQIVANNYGVPNIQVYNLVVKKWDNILINQVSRYLNKNCTEKGRFTKVAKRYFKNPNFHPDLPIPPPKDPNQSPFRPYPAKRIYEEREARIETVLLRYPTGTGIKELSIRLNTSEGNLLRMLSKAEWAISIQEKIPFTWIHKSFSGNYKKHKIVGPKINREWVKLVNEELGGMSPITIPAVTNLLLAERPYARWMKKDNDPAFRESVIRLLNYVNQQK